ncbi:hypothetical protein GWK47_020954 [Chionoecetes opilio]|uniref:Uncharacterized protein n=1 Tax=Chionoecetes opilio TaxID=41210 RepID=A0A8J5CKN0_CHIOP|nr:hypothetical protein GWK47_020954 [Chionoecetes opilio]
MCAALCSYVITQVQNRITDFLIIRLCHTVKSRLLASDRCQYYRSHCPAGEHRLHRRSCSLCWQRIQTLNLWDVSHVRWEPSMLITTLCNGNPVTQVSFPSLLLDLGLMAAPRDMAKVYSKPTCLNTPENSSDARHTDPNLGDERFKARPQATASVRAECLHHSRINGPCVAMAWKRYFCFLTKATKTRPNSRRLSYAATLPTTYQGTASLTPVEHANHTQGSAKTLWNTHDSSFIISSYHIESRHKKDRDLRLNLHEVHRVFLYPCKPQPAARIHFATPSLLLHRDEALTQVQRRTRQRSYTSHYHPCAGLDAHQHRT